MSESGNFVTEIDTGFEKDRILLMQDEYTAKDLQYVKYKKMLQREIIGPSLKDMEFNKRFNKVEKQLPADSDKKQHEQIHQNQNFQMDYFQSNYRSDMAQENSNKIKLEQSQSTLDLANKLDFMLRNEFKEI
jgi:hypothetical protein